MFKSLEALRQEFGIDSAVSSEDLIAELKRRRAAIHPDKAEGEFLSDAAKIQFTRLNEALDYIESAHSTSLALPSNTELSSLAATVVRLESTLEQMRMSAAPEKQVEKILKADIRRFGRSVQLTSGTCAAAFAALLAFSSKIAGNPIIGPLALSSAGKIVIQVLLVISAMTFALTWINEYRLKKMLTFLTSDEGLSAVLFLASQ